MTGKNRTILFEGLVNDAMRLVECAHLSVLHYQTKKAINTALFGDLAAYYLQKCLLFPTIYWYPQTYFLGIPLFQSISQFCTEVFFPMIGS